MSKLINGYVIVILLIHDVRIDTIMHANRFRYRIDEWGRATYNLVPHKSSIIDIINLSDKNNKSLY